MKLVPPRPGWLEKDTHRGVLAAYLNALADLAGPKRALPTLRDGARLETFLAALQHAVSQHRGVRRACCMSLCPPRSVLEGECLNLIDAFASAAVCDQQTYLTSDRGICTLF